MKMGMILNLAVGDAYGRSFEYAEPDFVVANNDGLSYKNHLHPLGTYTDDTQMTLAIAELMLSDVEWTPMNIANQFLAVFKRDERMGYARKFYAFLKEVTSAEEFLQKIKPDSDRSGGAMRVCPIGLYPQIQRVITVAKTQAAITHATDSGMEAAVVAALMTHYFVYDLGPKEKLAKWIQSKVEGTGWDVPYEGPVGEKGWMAVRAAMTAVAECNSMFELLKRCIAFTGDVDTVATIALAAGTFCREIKQDIPKELYRTLENGPYGRNYLVVLDVLLQSKFGIVL